MYTLFASPLYYVPFFSYFDPVFCSPNICCCLLGSWWTTDPFPPTVFFIFMCRLALYVYEYLLHVGAQKSAQTFLSEVSRKHAVRVFVWVGGDGPRTLCVQSEGWPDPHTVCPVSVAANWISRALQCWANRSVAADWLFNVSVAFRGTGAGAQGELRCSAWLTSFSDPLSSCVSVDLLQSHSHPFWVPCFLFEIFLLPSWSISATVLPEKRACPHFNSAEVKRSGGENEVGWFQYFAVNDSKLQCRRHWLVVHWPGEKENKERGMEKVTSSAGTSPHHSDLVCVRAHVQTHLSPTLWHPFLSAISLALSSADVGDEKDRRCRIQVWERIS